MCGAAPPFYNMYVLIRRSTTWSVPVALRCNPHIIVWHCPYLTANGTERLEHPHPVRRTTLKRILTNFDTRSWTRFVWGQSPVVGCCEHGNEHSGSIGRKFLDQFKAGLMPEKLPPSSRKGHQPTRPKCWPHTPDTPPMFPPPPPSKDICATMSFVWPRQGAKSVSVSTIPVIVTRPPCHSPEIRRVSPAGMAEALVFSIYASANAWGEIPLSRNTWPTGSLLYGCGSLQTMCVTITWSRLRHHRSISRPCCILVDFCVPRRPVGTNRLIFSSGSVNPSAVFWLKNSPCCVPVGSQHLMWCGTKHGAVVWGSRTLAHFTDAIIIIIIIIRNASTVWITESVALKLDVLSVFTDQLTTRTPPHTTHKTCPFSSSQFTVLQSNHACGYFTYTLQWKRRCGLQITGSPF
jgi:hypothetical protein